MDTEGPKVVPSHYTTNWIWQLVGDRTNRVVKRAILTCFMCIELESVVELKMLGGAS